MSRKLNILLACMLAGCTSPYTSIHNDQAEKIETLFTDFGARHRLMPMCMMHFNESQRIIDLEQDSNQPVQRWTEPRLCQFMWLDDDTVYHRIVLSNVRDVINTTETWTFRAIAQYENRSVIDRRDTIFARSSQLRTFEDSIPSYLEQAYVWTLSMRRSDLKRVYPKQ